MKLPRRLSATPLALALAAAGGLAMPAHAINLAPDGKGDRLIFPYYTVRNGFDTLLSVTNTSAYTVLANLEVRESRNGRSVGVFMLVLSPRDVWTGAVTGDGSGGALIRSFDKTCIYSQEFVAGPNGSTQSALSTVAYAEPVSDQGGTGLDRLQEGFVEVEVFKVSTVPESMIPATGDSIETSAQHVGGTPRSCSAVTQALDRSLIFTIPEQPVDYSNTPLSSFSAPQNVLFGSATLINVQSGHAYDVAPTTIQNSHGAAANTVQRFDRNGQLVTANVAENAVTDAISLLLMANSLTNEFAAGGNARTDWVITFPTKHAYTQARSEPAFPPFHARFGANGACDPFAFDASGRDEQRLRGDVDIALVRPPPTLCWTTNVLSFRNPSQPDRGVLDSPVTTLPVDTATLGYAGWAGITLTANAPLYGFTGLPVIGFALIERNNSAQAGNNRNYGSGRPHVVDLIAP